MAEFWQVPARERLGTGSFIRFSTSRIAFDCPNRQHSRGGYRFRAHRIRNLTGTRYPAGMPKHIIWTSNGGLHWQNPAPEGEVDS